MTKQHSLFRLTAIVLLITMIALVMVSGTLAKYAQEYAGDGTAIVAKWKVTLKDLGDNPISDTTSFNIFDKSAVYDLAGLTDAQKADLSLAPTNVDTDVATGTTDAIVAPGTWGKVGFKVAIDATNEVSVKYGINVKTLTNNISQLQFSVDGKNWVTADKLALEGQTPTAEQISLAYETVAPKTAVTEKTYTLFWKWDYQVGADKTAIDTNDATDTGLGTTGTATCVIEASFGAVQVD